MNRLVKYGLLLLVVSLLVLFGLGLSAQKAYANEEILTTTAYTPVEKAVAIKAADDSIFRILLIDRFLLEEDLQKFVTDVTYARALVNAAKENYNAEDSDFMYLSKLLEAEKKAEKLSAILAARNAIDEIEKYPVYSNEYKAAVKEARRLVEIAVEEYGATDFELCYRRLLLEEAEDKIAREPQPEPAPVDDQKPTPPTGSFPVGAIAGLLLSGSGIICIRKRLKGRH